MQGVIQGLNLGAYTAGDTLYLANTAGDYTNVKQYAPNHLVYVGIVERANVGNGQIYVRVQNGYELDELHNVQAQTPANNDVIYYDSSDQQWKTGNVTSTLQNAAADGTTKGVATFTAADFNDNGAGLISIDYTNGQAASGSTKGFLTSTDWTTFNNKGNGTVTSVTGTSPIASSGGTTPAISIQDAAADGTTKGAATFTASDFNATSGVISIDYTNGQAANGSTKGFLTSADWTTFNNKISGKAYDLTSDQTAVTGTTANTYVNSFLIPANTVSVGQIWELKYRARKTGTGGVTTLRVYANTSAAIGGTLIAVYQTTNTALGITIFRNLVVKTATNTEVMNTGISNQLLDYLNSTTAYSALNIDWTTDKYIVFAIQNANNADSTVVSMAEFKTTY